MNTDKLNEEILRLYEPTGYKDIRTFNNSLSASMWFKSVPLLQHMSPNTKAHPVGILAAMQQLTNFLVYYNQDFILLQSRQSATEQKGVFITFIQHYLTEEFYKFIDSEIDSVDLVNNTINFKQHVFWEKEAVSITKKNWILCEKLYTEKGECIATIYTGAGVVNLTQRRIDNLSEDVILKASFIKHGQKPSYINIENIPHDDTIKIETSNAVDKSHLDINNHANSSFFISSSMEQISILSNMLGKGTPVYKEFSIVFKTEAVLGDQLKNIAWKGDGKYYCKIMKNNKIVTFVKSTCFSQNNVTSKL